MIGRDDPDSPPAPQLFCDLTQSWSEVGGGVRTYLLHKRRHILESTPHRHLMIIPGARDEVIEEERAITVTIKSPHVPAARITGCCCATARSARRSSASGPT